MKKFSFTLQQWYDMQLGVEKQHKLQISAIEAQIRALREELRALLQRFDKSKVEYCGGVCAGMMALRADDYGRFFDSTKHQMAAVQAGIDRLEREKELWLQKLVRVRREIKLLDKLREKQYSAYLDGVKKENGKFIDDLVSYRVTVS